MSAVLFTLILSNQIEKRNGLDFPSDKLPEGVKKHMACVESIPNKISVPINWDQLMKIDAPVRITHYDEYGSHINPVKINIIVHTIIFQIKSMSPIIEINS